ncbi:MAG: SurA N-terminal domain-containing protein [Deltaproteobacteria bacterium]|nr:SurA N-terminal domain-containing protein [Deltaproteobacteria bacterium]
MLNVLRKNKESVIIKVILGFIILSFAAFFGISSMEKGNLSVAVPASVNGEGINPVRFNYYLDTQLEQLKSVFKDNIPPEYLASAQANVANLLINRQLIDDTIRGYGFRISPDELAEHIKNNAQFQRDGKFDFNYYQDRYLPGYKLQTGGSYEKDASAELLSEKIFGEFKNIMEPTSEELERRNTIDNTLFSFSVVKVFMRDNDADAEIKPDAKAPADNKKTDDKITPEQKAQKIFDEWKKGTNIQPLLDEYKLSQTNMPDITYSKIKSVFGGKGEIKNLKEIISLTTENPFTSAVIKEDNYYYIVKLTDIKKTETSSEESEQSLTTLKETYSEEIASSLQSAFIKDLRKDAKIQFNEQIK